MPLGGALFTAEILIGSMNLPVILPALACSGTATFIAWAYLPRHATYLDILAYPFAPRLLIWAVLAGPVIGLFAAGYVRLIGWVSHHRARGAWAIGAPLVAFAILAVIALKYPQLYGNGKGMAHSAFLGLGSLGLVAALSMLKPLVTALGLSSAASGGLFTPVLSTGAVAGAFLELTHNGFDLMVPMLAATVIATAVTRWIDGYSIYSARLSAPAPALAAVVA